MRAKIISWLTIALMIEMPFFSSLSVFVCPLFYFKTVYDECKYDAYYSFILLMKINLVRSRWKSVFDNLIYFRALLNNYYLIFLAFNHRHNKRNAWNKALLP
jgi:hypothetical protein